MSYITILHDRRHGEPSSDEDTAAPDAGEGHRNKKRPDFANVGCVSCVLGIHVNIYVKAWGALKNQSRKVVVRWRTSSFWSLGCEVESLGVFNFGCLSDLSVPVFL